MLVGHRDNGKRFIVRADEKLTAFLEPQTAVRKRQAPPRTPPDPLPAGLTREQKARSHNQPLNELL